MGYIYKRFEQVFTPGEKFKIISTGEVLVYQSSTGGANWSSYVTVALAGKMEVEIGSFWLHQVVKVDDNGNVIDDFSQYR